MEFTLDFEKPVQELENQIEELKHSSGNGVDFGPEIQALEQKVKKLGKEIYQNLTPWQRVQLSRHPKRPHTTDYITHLIEDFHELHGDRRFGDDPSLICGLGYLRGQKVCVVGIDKGTNTSDKIKRNFGMPRPEGYRKAIRVMEFATRFNIPVISFVDTPGAYPGIDAEERGQSAAIAENLERLFGLKAPHISLIIGEGGSGGALGIAIADSVLMLEYSVYSVIAPESCASILWSDPKMAEQAANSLKLSPEKAYELSLIDQIVEEPLGGAHRFRDETFQSVRETLLSEIERLQGLSVQSLKEARFEKFRNMGNATLMNDEGGKS